MCNWHNSLTKFGSTLCTWCSMIMCCEVLAFLFSNLVGCQWLIWLRSCGKLGRELGLWSSPRLDSWLPCEHNMNVGWLLLVSQSVLSLYEHLTRIVITLSAHYMWFHVLSMTCVCILVAWTRVKMWTSYTKPLDLARAADYVIQSSGSISNLGQLTN